MSDDRPGGRKTLLVKRILTLFTKKVPAKSVPAAAARQVGQALSFIIGRIGYVGFKKQN